MVVVTSRQARKSPAASSSAVCRFISRRGCWHNLGTCVDDGTWRGRRKRFSTDTRYRRPLPRHPGLEPGSSRRASARREDTLPFARISGVIAPQTRRCWIPVTSTGMTEREEASPGEALSWSSSPQGKPENHPQQAHLQCVVSFRGEDAGITLAHALMTARGEAGASAFPRTRGTGALSPVIPALSRDPAAVRPRGERAPCRLHAFEESSAPPTRRGWIPVTSTGMTEEKLAAPSSGLTQVSKHEQSASLARYQL